MQIVDRFWHSFATWATGFGGPIFLIGICLLVLWYFTPAFLSSQAAKALLLNVGLGCLAFALVSGYFITKGFKSCSDLVASRDAAAIQRAAIAVKEIEACRDGGGRWEVIDGTCHND